MNEIGQLKRILWLRHDLYRQTKQSLYVCQWYIFSKLWIPIWQFIYVTFTCHKTPNYHVYPYISYLSSILTSDPIFTILLSWQDKTQADQQKLAWLGEVYRDIFVTTQTQLVIFDFVIMVFQTYIEVFELSYWTNV